jgi:1,4-alpha-glucan branching enzyme
MKSKVKPATKGAGSHGGCVCFGLSHPTARQVCIAGSFNDWHPSVTPMIRLDDGKWAKELALPPGRYEYRFVVDGVWVDDPAAKELIPNSFGTANAVLVVGAAEASSPKRSGIATSPTRQTAGKSNLAEHGELRCP